MKSKLIEITILCGGSGKRMGKLALNKQKCMLEVENRPILEHLFEQIIKAFGRARVILLVGYRSDDVRDYFGERYKSLQLDYAPESVTGTRLALLGAESFIEGEYFLSLGGDTIVNGTELKKLVKPGRVDLMGTILVSTKEEIAPTHGLAIMEGRRLLKIDFPPTQPIFKGQSLRLMDIGFYSKKLFGYLKISNIPTISGTLDNLIRKGKLLEGKLYDGIWFHFMKPKDLQARIHF